MATVVDDPLYVGADSVALLSIDNSFGAGLADAQRERWTPRSSLIFDTTRRRSRSTTRLRTCSSVPDAVTFTSVSGRAGHPRCIQPSDYDAPWVFSAGMFGNDVPSSYNGFYSASLSSVRTDGYFTSRADCRISTGWSVLGQRVRRAVFDGVCR